MRVSARDGHMPWLDWLRFGAALIVVFGHVRQVTFVEYGRLLPEDQNVASAAFMLLGRAGYEAVMVFFVISGFLVGGMAIDRAWKRSFEWRRYTADRIGRIGTPLIPAIVISTVVAVVIDGQVDWLVTLGNLFSLQGVFVANLPKNAPIWSLAYEVWFYVLGGAIAVCVLRRRLVATAACVAALALAMFLKLDVTYLLIWAGGAVLYFVRPTRFRGFILAIAVLLSGSGFLLSQLTRDSNALQRITFVSHELALIILTVGIGLLLVALREAPCPQWLGRSGSAAAKPSYTLYLTHVPAIHIYAAITGLRPGQLTAANSGAFFCLLTFCLLASLVSYWAFERNTESVKAVARRLLGCTERPCSQVQDEGMVDALGLEPRTR